MKRSRFSRTPLAFFLPVFVWCVTIVSAMLGSVV